LNGSVESIDEGSVNRLSEVRTRLAKAGIKKQNAAAVEAGRSSKESGGVANNSTTGGRSGVVSKSKNRPRPKGQGDGAVRLVL
jgi:hypothetical protein